MTKKQKRMLKNIILALVCFLVVLTLDKVLKYGFSESFPYGIASIIPSKEFGWLIKNAQFVITSDPCTRLWMRHYDKFLFKNN